MLVLLVAIKSS